MKNSILTFLLIALFVSCSKDDPTPPMEDPIEEPSEPDLPEEFAAWANLFDGEGVGAMVNLTEDVLLIFNMSGTRYVWFENQEIQAEYEVNSSDSHFANSQLNTVGAAVLLWDYRIYMFDEEGERYTYFNINPDEVAGRWNDFNAFSHANNNWDTWQWGPDYTIPFSRVSSMWLNSDPGSECFDAMEVFEMLVLVDDSGTEMVEWMQASFQWGEEYDVDQWTAENNCGGQDGLIPFSEIGAACRYVKPNTIQEIIFNAAGTSFVYYNVSEGIFSEVYEIY